MKITTRNKINKEIFEQGFDKTGIQKYIENEMTTSVVLKLLEVWLDLIQKVDITNIPKELINPNEDEYEISFIVLKRDTLKDIKLLLDQAGMNDYYKKHLYQILMEK